MGSPPDGSLDQGDRGGGLGDLDVPAGTDAEIDWTQDRRGSYAVGTVVAAPAGSPAGVYIRIDRSASGIDRRLGVRVATRVPASLMDAYGDVFDGHAVDLSLGGARVIADVRPAADQVWPSRDRGPFSVGEQIAAVMHLPDALVAVWCQVAAVGADPGDVRLSFRGSDSSIGELLADFLQTVQDGSGADQD